MTQKTKPSESTTDNGSAAEILLKILEQLPPTETDRDTRIRAEMYRLATEIPV